MSHQRVVDAGEGHLVIGQGNDAGFLVFHQHLQPGHSLAVGIVVGGFQGVEFGGLLVQALLQTVDFGLAGSEFGIQFFQFGTAHLRTSARTLRAHRALGSRSVQLVNQTLDLGSLSLDGAVLLGQLAAIVVTGALHLLILLHDLILRLTLLHALHQFLLEIRGLLLGILQHHVYLMIFLVEL